MLDMPEDALRRLVGLSLIGLALAVTAAYVWMFLEPPSVAWRPLHVRLAILASVALMSLVIGYIGVALLRSDG